MEILDRICSGWLSKLELAKEGKDSDFGKHARDAMKFYKGPYDFLYDEVYANNSLSLVVEGFHAPAFRVSINKVAELVQLFLPSLYHRNPVYVIKPKFLHFDQQTLVNLMPPEIQMQAQQMAAMTGMPPPNPADILNKDPQQISMLQISAEMLQFYLNQSVRESDLKTQVRHALTESLIKGRGLVWTELIRSPHGIQVASLYDSVDHLLLDPDAERMQDCKWIARFRRQSARDVEAKFRLPDGSLQGKDQSSDQKAKRRLISDEEANSKSAKGKTYDVVEYWEIYSRMGIGGELSGAVTDEQRLALKAFGQYVYLAICDGVPYPLNLPPRLLESGTETEIYTNIQWHTPFYEDFSHPWPFIHFDFHDIPRSVWPMAHIRPAMGELKAMQWLMSFIVSKIRNISRDFVVVDKGIEEDLKNKILYGPDLTMLEVGIRGNRTIADIIQFVKHEQINPSVFDVYAALERNFERRTGLTELGFGGPLSKQMRSATEANLRNENMNVRPDDMANRVEDAMSQVGKNHAIAARVHMQAADIAPIFGESIDPGGMQFETGMRSEIYGPLTQTWLSMLGNQDISAIISEFNYTVEAGSARKPNKVAEMEKATEALQVIMPIASQHYQQWGDPSVLNFILQRWYRANDVDPQESAYFPDMQQQLMMMQQQMQAGPPPEGEEQPPDV